MFKDDLHPAIQTAVLHLAHPDLSLADIGKQQGITKQAVQKRLLEANAFLATYKKPPPSDDKIKALKADLARQSELINSLQRRLVLQATRLFMLMCFKDRVLAFFPKFNLRRLNPFEKKESSTTGLNSSASAVRSKTSHRQRTDRQIQFGRGSPRF
jgi:predicted DNA-binding protein YlxM (UPF0122 family)